MPCNTITTQSIKLAKAMPEIIEKALQDAGWKNVKNINNRITATQMSDSVIWETGRGITITTSMNNKNETYLKEISQAYSKCAITWAAQRAGWNITNIKNNQLTLQRR